ncbi:MAG TPA: Imm63 family immunity protein [Chitinophagales bacterium]|nr:Imm63 family immunity protein [Chitinophagales bacterium]
MSVLSAKDLEVVLRNELLKISNDFTLLPAINSSNYDAKPFIEIDRYGYNYVCCERNQEIFRKLPIDTEQLLYEVFRDISFRLAIGWESKNRLQGEDFRRQLFAKRIELMGKINPVFAEKMQEEINQILLHYPYSTK